MTSALPVMPWTTEGQRGPQTDHRLRAHFDDLPGVRMSCDDLTPSRGTMSDLGDAVEPASRVPRGFAIQGATTADTGELLTLQRAAYVKRSCRGPLLASLTQTLEDLAAEPDRKTYPKAVTAGRIVGTVRASDESGIRHIGRLAVAPDQQGRGMGTALLHAVEALAGKEVTAFALFTGAASAGNLRL